MKRISIDNGYHFVDPAEAIEAKSQSRKKPRVRFVRPLGFFFF